MQVTRENLADAVRQALSMCDQQLAKAAEGAGDKAAVQDLRMAKQGLELISSELNAGNVNARQPRSGIFTSYVVDEGSRIVLDPVLKNLIMKIEDVYRRM